MFDKWLVFVPRFVWLFWGFIVLFYVSLELGFILILGLLYDFLGFVYGSDLWLLTWVCSLLV